VRLTGGEFWSGVFELGGGCTRGEEGCQGTGWWEGGSWILNYGLFGTVMRSLGINMKNSGTRVVRTADDGEERRFIAENI
jgi:hypothetical protein